MSAKEAIHTASAPDPVGPYSQAVKTGGFVFVSGQIPIHCHTGQLVEDSIGEKTRTILKNIRSIARSVGGGSG